MAAQNLSLSQLKELSNEELRVRVAKVVGWQPVGESYVLWKSPLQARGVTEGPWFPFSAVPNYPEDLNAIAEAEKTLSEAEFHRYKVKLALICGDDFWESDKYTHWSSDTIVALARQRAIAFLAVRGREG